MVCKIVKDPDSGGLAPLLHSTLNTLKPLDCLKGFNRIKAQGSHCRQSRR